MDISRRAMLTRLLGAASLTSLATGIPASFLRLAGCRRAEVRPRRGPGERMTNAQFLVLAVSRQGNPINANVPGAYEHEGIIHPPAAEAQGASLRVGTRTVTGAQAWSALPQAVLDRTCFFHGTTGTLAHVDLPKVIALMGATARDEMLPSVFSAALAPALETVTEAPLSLLGNSGFPEEYVSFEGRTLTNYVPTSVRDVLLDEAGSLSSLRRLRDRAMDDVHARLASTGTPEERAFLDSVAQSPREAADLGEHLLDRLRQITDNGAGAQILVAAVLIKMKVTPVVVVDIPFGGDNHQDDDLTGESSRLVSGVGHIQTLMAQLAALGLQDKTTFMSLNPFGRTLKELGTRGRNHLDHHVSIVIGRGIRGGVIGGVAPVPAGDYAPLEIDSSSGRGVESGGDVPRADQLASLGKTVGAGLGIPAATLDAAISRGKIVPAALIS